MKKHRSSQFGTLLNQSTKVCVFFYLKNGPGRHLHVSKCPNLHHLTTLDGLERQSFSLQFSWEWMRMETNVGRPLAQYIHFSTHSFGTQEGACCTCGGRVMRITLGQKQPTSLVQLETNFCSRGGGGGGGAFHKHEAPFQLALQPCSVSAPRQVPCPLCTLALRTFVTYQV